MLLISRVPIVSNKVKLHCKIIESYQQNCIGNVVHLTAKKELTMKVYIMLFGFFMSGCAVQCQLAKLDQHAWTEYTCSGIKSWNDCKQEALNACPEGFYVKNELENLLIQRRVFETTCKVM
jgi:hypothetical protein